MLTISRTRLLAGAATLALTASLGVTPGLAQETATMDVTATVAESCTVTVDGALSFGSIDRGQDGNASSSFTVDCASGGSVNIEVGQGGNHDGSFRHMAIAGTTNLLKYDLTNPELGQWALHTVNLTGDPTTFVVDGFISAADTTSAAVGDYSDQVEITLTFNGS